MFRYRCRYCNDILETDEPPKFIQFCLCCNRKMDYYSCDLWLLPRDRIISILENELLRRRLNNPIGIQYIWQQKDGSLIELNKMQDSHILNIIDLIRRKTNEVNK